ncbi:MAG TPA: hypothetical protein VK742_15490 [Candidatus Sulfotelmatobacter sp.]|nr:hypothetical protein [Candidatus Sulfotelmatobacter sp.]
MMPAEEKLSASLPAPHAGRFFCPFAMFLFIAALHLWFYTHLPESRRDDGWPSIVMRNWHEYGYAALHGQLVANPGGLVAGEAQFVYPGHRPAFLIAPYLLKELPGAAFGDGALYDFAVLAATFAAMLGLFGNNWRGIFFGAVICFTPGFINNVAAIDTINVPALFSLSVLGFAAAVFSRRDSSLMLRVVALAATLVFMCLNWSTLFPLGVAAVYIFCKRRDWRPAAVFFIPALLVGLAVLVVSMQSKHTGTGATGGDFWNAYLFGPLGYDHGGMTWGKAFVRIGAVNSIAWLSLAAAGLVALFLNGRGENWRRAPWPLLAGIAAVFALRNYNAHHPWNSVCYIGLGLLFSLELLTANGPDSVPHRSRFATVAALVFTLAYAIAWMALDDFNARDLRTVRDLVVNNTPRHGLVLVAGDLLPAGPADLKNFTEMFDRKLEMFEDWNHQADGREVFVLTHGELPAGASFVAKSHLEQKGTDKVVAVLFDFYRANIARRSPGIRRTYFDDYQLGKF